MLRSPIQTVQKLYNRYVARDPRAAIDCIYCDDFEFGGDFSVNKMISIGGAAQARQDGCSNCSLICTLIEIFCPWWSIAFADLLIHVSVCHYDDAGVLLPVQPIHLVVEGFRRARDERLTMAEIVVSAPFGKHIPEWPTLGYSRPLAKHSGEKECFDFIFHQIEHCLVNHGSTCSRNELAPFPKRILNVGEEGDEIVVMDAEDRSGRYATLSHCWGDGDMLKLSAKSEKQLKQGIAEDLLPKTYQDAVTVTRKLGLKFLWIDSLCIIQDSKEDWEIESAKMAQYYEQAFITIAASSSRSGDMPFLCQRDDVWRAHDLPHEDKDRNTFMIVAQKRETPGQIRGRHQLGPLSDRAWSFQENILSNRLVHYLKSEVIWECRHGMVSEDGRALMKSHMPSVGLASDAYRKITSEPWESWHDIVKAYSSRALTFSSDKLPAVAGITSKVYDLTSSEYVAGLWKDNLIADLLWYSHEDLAAWNLRVSGQLPQYGVGKTCPCPIENGSPSWSWASVQFGIDYLAQHNEKERKLFEQRMEILAIDVKGSPLNPFGQVTAGSMTVKGRIVEAVLVSNDPTDSSSYYIFKADANHQVVENNLREITDFKQDDLGPDLAPDTPLEQIQLNLPNGNVEDTVRRSKNESADPMASICAKVWCIDVGTIPKYNGDFVSWEHDRSFALVVARSQSNPSLYARVGIMLVHKTHCIVENWSQATKEHRAEKDSFFRDASEQTITIE